MQNNSVKAWEEQVVIPTYGTGKPDKNPMFFEKRVYQGSSGVVYPNPVIEKILDEKKDVTYNGIFLENKYLKIMILPELGGRVQMAYDKLKQRHFVYYNQVIKPALVGLTGPWISGGIEFNWPQHHRPSTFEPVDANIEQNKDGSVTVWVNEIERMFRTKGMAGFTLHPDKAYLEIKVKLNNRTSLPQTFLWWANPAVKVNDYYQSVFPPDVNAVFDHGKRDVSTFPIATGTYYKVDYAPGTDISWYKNIPVPTSYMAINSDYDFVGGYEHDAQAGMLHVANHHVSPGKKQWTWGHSDFGQAWDRNLTDEDGPYIELMTGVFTDNQPDFSWLMPHEEKSFTQYFLPYRELGLVKNATKDLLVNLEIKERVLQLKVYATSELKDCRLCLKHTGETLLEKVIDVAPELVFKQEITLPAATIEEDQLLLTITSAAGKELLRYEPGKNRKNQMPEPAKPALPPASVENNEQLFLTAQHLEQYRHATFSPVPYYEEALKRDPNDIRNNNGLGLWFLRRGQFAKSESFFRKAIGTSTSRNPNPYESEPYYNLGLSLKLQGKDKEAYDALYKATWSSAWQDSSFFLLAQIAIARGDLQIALDHLNHSLSRNAMLGKAYVLKAAVLRKLQKPEEAKAVCLAALEQDTFNLGALFEQVLLHRNQQQPEQEAESLKLLYTLSRQTGHNLLEYALDYAAAGLYEEAKDLLQHACQQKPVSPLTYYHLAYFATKLQQEEKAKGYLEQAARADAYLCFPNRLEDIAALQFAIENNTTDAKAPYYLGNLWYDKRQYADAIACWELAAERDPAFPTVRRNLGIAYYNKQNNADKALRSYEKAFALDTTDARVLMELDQLYKRLNRNPEERLQFLNKHLHTVMERDDLYLERLSLYNSTGIFQEAYDLLTKRKFHPWEGGEGKVSGQYVLSLVELAKAQLQQGKPAEAVAMLEQAQTYPHNLGEGKLHGAQENNIFYWLACAYEALGQTDAATAFMQKATTGLSEPGAAMFYNDQQPDTIFYQGLAWRKLGDEKKAESIFSTLLHYGQQHEDDEVHIDYFAVSLPNLLVFEDNLQIRNQVHCWYMKGLGLAGLNRAEEAASYYIKVLQQDAMHTGAKIHLDLLDCKKWQVQPA